MLKRDLFRPRFSCISLTRPQAKIQIGAFVRLSQLYRKVKRISARRGLRVKGAQHCIKRITPLHHIV